MKWYKGTDNDHLQHSIPNTDGYFDHREFVSYLEKHLSKCLVEKGIFITSCYTCMPCYIWPRLKLLEVDDKNKYFH